MSTNRIQLIVGTSATFDIDLVDDEGIAISTDRLIGAVGDFVLRNSATDVSNVIQFKTDTTPLSLLFMGSTLRLVFVPTDTASLLVQGYVYRLVLTLADGSVFDVIEWNPFDLILGGVTTPTPPAFDNTVKIDHNLDLSDNYRYMTAGGSPIASAQVRVYYKSDYDVGNLASPVGVTLTTLDGRWTTPILVLPGFSYVIRFDKPNEFGPDTATIIV